jgi:hypothetical protein
MAIGPRYRKFLADCAERGIDAFEAARLPEARDIYNQDSIERQKKLEGMSAEEFVIIDDNTGQPVTSFTSEEARRAAFSNPLYATSPGYRAKVAEIMANTDQVPGVTFGKGALEQAMHGGNRDEAMLAQARKEAAIELRRDLFAKAGRSAQDRLRLLEYLASEDETIQSQVAEVTAAHNKPTPLKDEMIRMQQAGDVARVQVMPSAAELRGEPKPRVGDDWS